MGPALINRGLAALARAGELGGAHGPYALQAAIAACHARAFRAEDTDWARIAALYAVLAEVMPSPIVQLNRAVAVSMADGPQAGLDLVDALAHEPSLQSYHLLPSVRADLLVKVGRPEEARVEFERAADLTSNARERDLSMERALRRRHCAPPRPEGQVGPRIAANCEGMPEMGESRRRPGAGLVRARLALLAMALVVGIAAPITWPSAWRSLSRLRSPTHGIHVVAVSAIDDRQLNVRVSSDALGRAVDVRILLPPGYAQDPATRYPVLYLFHGTSGRASDWVTMGDAEATTARLPLIVVMPDAGFDGNGGGWFTNWVDTTTALGPSQWETFHVDQLIPWVDANLRTIATRDGRAVAGLSQGASARRPTPPATRTRSSRRRRSPARPTSTTTRSSRRAPPP